MLLAQKHKKELVIRILDIVSTVWTSDIAKIAEVVTANARRSNEVILEISRYACMFVQYQTANN